MRKLFLALAFIITAFTASSQSRQPNYYWRIDTLTLGYGGSGELIILNSTKNVTGGFLKNTGNGLTTFATLAISDVAGLQTAIDGKAALSHSHIIADVTGLQTSLNAKLNISDTATMLAAYQTYIATKQATLVSGTNIKTVNGSSLLGSGNITINSGIWGNITGTLSDQTDLQSALDAKVPTARTLTINGTAYDLSANRSWTIAGTDTTSLSARINLKLNISDTSSMLSAYLTAINARVKYTDTSSMLSAYLTAINARVKYTDTSGMLSAYATALNARLKISDTSSMLSAYLTAINARVKYTDTSTMLGGYLRKVDTSSLSSRINLKVNISDTATMLTNYLATNEAIHNQSATIQSATFSIYGPMRIGTNQSVDARLKFLIKDTTTGNGGFAAMSMKTYNDTTDLNMAGMVMVKHDKNYDLTPGYANTLQLYTLARSAGTIIGNNNFIGADTMTTYAPTHNSIANGFIRFEVGPKWPRSEKMRINNQGDIIFGWTRIAGFTASQSNDTITDLVNSFSSSYVGKFFTWGDSTLGGKYAFADRVVEYIDAHHIRVETRRTIASQGGRVSSANAIIDTLGNARFRIGFFDSLRIGDETAGYYRFVPSSSSLKLLRFGSSTPDTTLDLRGISVVQTGRDLVIEGGGFAKLWWKNTTTSLFDIKADATATTFKNNGATNMDFINNGVTTNRITSTKTQNYVSTIIAATDDTPLGRLDVRTNSQSISTYIDNTRTTGTNYGILVDATTTGASESRAGYFTANGATIDKAIMIPSSSGSGSADFALSIETIGKSYFAGKVGIGVSDASAKLNVLATTEQLRLSYDANTYLSATVGSAGATTFDGVGLGSTAITFSDSVIFSSKIKAINLIGSATTADSALYVNRSTGYLEMRKLPAGGGGTGDVVGPSSATDNAIARFDGTTGKLIQNSGLTIDDVNNLGGVNQLDAKAINVSAITDANAEVFVYSTGTGYSTYQVGTDNSYMDIRAYSDTYADGARAGRNVFEMFATTETIFNSTNATPFSFQIDGGNALTIKADSNIKFNNYTTGFLKSDADGDITSSAIAESDVTNLVTDLGNKQPLDADLTTIAGLTATTDNFLVSVSSAWASRTPAQVKTTLSLNNVENTALSTWTGTANISTLGTITTGTWNAGKLTATLTSEQMRLAYDGSNYLTATIGSAGATTFDATGTGSTAITFSDSVIFSSKIKAINLIGSATTADSALYVNRTSGYLEMRKLPSGGGYTIVNVTSTSSSPAQTSGEIVILVDAATAGGAVTINLPTAVGNTAKFHIKKIDSGSNTVTMDGNSTETIDGATTKVINFQWTSLTIVSNGSNWYIL